MLSRRRFLTGAATAGAATAGLALVGQPAAFAGKVNGRLIVDRVPGGGSAPKGRRLLRARNATIHVLS